MLYPIKVADVELGEPIKTLTGLEDYMGLQAIVRLHGVPIGYVNAPVSNGCVDGTVLINLILEQHSRAIIKCLLQNGLASPHKNGELRIEDLFDVKPQQIEGALPLVTTG